MNILTFDIEDWYNCDFISNNNWDKYEVRIYDGVKKILDELEKRIIKGTFFCLGWIAEKHPQVIKDIAAAGHQIGCHSYQHKLSTHLDEKSFKSDTYKAKSLIEDVIGTPVNIYRAPGFSFTEKNLWTYDVLASLDFKYDCSVFPSHHDYGGMPSYGKSEPAIIFHKGIEIREFPISVHNFLGQNFAFSGGGFFRLFPYYIIKKWSQKTDYLMTYFHPRDFDPDQPIIKELPLNRKFKSYVGLRTSFHKFQCYLNDFDFVNVTQAEERINWSEVRIINL